MLFNSPLGSLSIEANFEKEGENACNLEKHCQRLVLCPSNLWMSVDFFKIIICHSQGVLLKQKQTSANHGKTFSSPAESVLHIEDYTGTRHFA